MHDDDFEMFAEEQTRLVLPVETSLRDVLARALHELMEDKNPVLKLQVMHKGLIYRISVTTTSIHPPIGLRDEAGSEDLLTQFGSRMQ